MAKKLLTKTEQKQSKHEIVWRLRAQGLTQSQIGQAVGYSQGHISTILSAIKDLGGLDQYQVGCSPGSGSKLNESQRHRLIKLLKKEAKANGFATDGWTQKRVRQLIKTKFGVSYSRAYISDLLSDLGFTLQVPRLLDVRQDEKRRQQYQEQTLPALKKKALQTDHEVVYVDECSFCMSGNQFTTYAPRGKGVTLTRYQSVTERVYSISGVTPQGQIHYAVQNKAFNSEQVIDFLNGLLDQLKAQVHVVWDNASIHVSKAIKAFLDKDRPRRRLTLYALPKYSPELNPDEQVWNHLKNHDLIRQEFSKKTQLIQAIERQLDKLQALPQLIRSFFKHPDVDFL